LSQVSSLQSEDGKTAVGQQPLGLGDGGGRVDLLVVRQTSSCELCTEILHHQIINSLVVNLRTGLTLFSSTRPATPWLWDSIQFIVEELKLEEVANNKKLVELLPPLVVS